MSDFIHGIGKDLTVGLRTLRKDYAFTLVAVFTLGSLSELIARSPA